MILPAPVSAPKPLVLVDAEHPWLGLASFSEETQRYFFGRDAEIAEIFVRVRDNTLTILYGQSGLGKSSLLGAGLLPKLRVENYKPVQIRLRYDDTAPPLIEQVFDEIERAGLLGKSRPPGLWEWLHHRENRPSDFDRFPPVLVFDQFEEIFTLGQRAERLEEAHALFTQLAELIENRTPAALRTRFQEDRRISRDYDNAPTPARLVITLREDFLSHLEQWKKLLPSLMKNRMDLKLLNGPQALEAVVRPGRMEGRYLVDDEVGAAIVRFVAKKETHVPLEEIGAVPPLLSLVCDELNRLRLAQNLPAITAGVVETQSSDILNNFYHESFANLPDFVRHFIEDRLITEGGHRNPVAQEDAMKALRRAGVENPQAALDQLVARRLISPEERAGLLWIEITHDVLAPLVVRSRDERLERERTADAEKRELEARLARNKMRLLLGLFSILTLIAVAGAIIGLVSYREAKRQRDEARFNEGLGWLLRAQVAEERKFRYPETLLYAAQSIGFDGVGRSDDAPENLLRYIREERNPEAYREARQWISNRPAYLPVWSSDANHSPSKCIDVSPDGHWLALGTEDGSVRLWDFQRNDEKVVTPPGGGPVSAVAFHSWGGSLRIATRERIRSWNLAKSQFEDGDRSGADCYALGNGGRIAASAVRAGSIDLVEDGQTSRVDTGGGDVASHLAFSADDSLIAALLPQSGIRMIFTRYHQLANAWNPLVGTPTQSIRMEFKDRPMALSIDSSRITALAIRPDGRTLVSGGNDGSIGLWDLESARPIGQSSSDHRHSGAVRGMAFRSDGRQFASASDDGTIRLWSVSGDNTPTIVATLAGHAGSVTLVRYLPGGKLLASAGSDGSCRLWDVSGEPAKSPDLHVYLKRNWFHFDPTTHQAIASDGTRGCANVPAGSVTDIWSRGGAQVFRYLMGAGEWTGAINQSPATPPSELTSALIADAGNAAKANRWSHVEMRLGQLERIGCEAGAELKQRRAALFAEGKPLKNTEGIEMLWCPPGEFYMGSPPDEPDRANWEIRHKVTLTNGFWLGKFELTQSQWLMVAGQNPSTYAVKNLEAPVENISWNDAMEYCRLLTDRERGRGGIPPGWEYTLPTEAQWEYACRAGTNSAYSFGDSPLELHRFGNFNDKAGGFVNSAGTFDPDQDDGCKYTSKVGSYLPNAWGFHDMLGNVFEWCRDSIDIIDFHDAAYSKADAVDPLRTSGERRINRGGGFYYPAKWCRSACRNTDVPEGRDFNCGFRIALVRELKSESDR